MALRRLEGRGLLQRTAVEREIKRRLVEATGWQPTLVSKDHTYALSFDLLRSWVAQKHPLGTFLR